MSHPASCREVGCQLSYREHLLGIAIAAAATPNRRPLPVHLDATERQGEKDRRAYRAMRNQGIQPPHVDGSHELAQTVKDQADIRPLGESIFRRMKREPVAL